MIRHLRYSMVHNFLCQSTTIYMLVGSHQIGACWSVSNQFGKYVGILWVKLFHKTNYAKQFTNDCNNQE